jgi:putative cell wall-binding protein
MKRITSLVLCAVLVLVVASVAFAADKSTKPRLAVLEFKNKADNQWWYSGGAEAAQDVFVTELV